MRRAGIIMLGFVLTGVSHGLGGCAPVYRNFDPEAPDSPVHQQRAQARLLAAERDRIMAEVQAARQAGQSQRAIVLLRDYLVVDPTYAAGYRVMGEVRLERGDYVNAEGAFDRAGQIDPSDFAAHYGQGVALAMEGRFGEAVSAYHRALAVRPNSPEANMGLASTYLRLNDLINAQVFAEKAVERDARNGAARATLGAVYERLGSYEKAVGQYEMALEYLDPTPPLLINLINAQIAADHDQGALASAERLVRLSPTADAYEKLGWCAAKFGDRDRSDDAYRKALDEQPDHWRALNGIGLNAYYRWQLSEKRDEAAVRDATEAFRRSLRINPDQAEIIRIMLRFER